MSPEYYLSQMKIYSRFVRNFNPAQQDTQKMLRIAVGPGGSGPRWTEWTETIMKAWQRHTWSWDIEGLSLHNYTVVDWNAKHKSVGFGEAEYSQILKTTLEMDRIINEHAAIMDKYDPDKKVALVVDEWGAWYAPLPGSNPGFLVQQNSLRDAVLAALNLNIFARHADRVRMANIAQMVNVLQAMIITDKEKMVLTPTYHVFKMYVPFQDATFVPVTFEAGTYTSGNVTLPRIDAIAARDAAGTLWVALTNVDPNRPADVAVRLSGMSAVAAAGETLTAAAVDAVNTFEAPTDRRAEADLGEGAGRSAHPDTRAEVGDRYFGPVAGGRPDVCSLDGRQPIQRRRVGFHLERGAAVDGADVPARPEIADHASPAEAHVRPVDPHLFFRRVAEVEHGQVLRTRARRIRHPRDLVPSDEQLAACRRLLIDLQDLVVRDERQRELVVVGQVAAEHERRAGDRPERHERDLLVAGEPGHARVAAFRPDADLAQRQHVRIGPVSRLVHVRSIGPGAGTGS